MIGPATVNKAEGLFLVRSAERAEGDISFGYMG